MNTTSPKFSYSTNTGGPLGLVHAQQLQVLAQLNLNFKIINDSSFVHLGTDGMDQLCREVLTEMNTDELSQQYQGETLHVLRSDSSSESNTFLLGTHEKPLLIINFTKDGSNDYDYDYDSILTNSNIDEVNVFYISFSGVENLVNKALELFSEKKKGISSEKTALIRWYVPSSHGGLKDFNFQLKKDWNVVGHYPWIKTSLEQYYKAFSESNAQIIVLYGKPGTGKTSFIRDMICELGLNSIISYDLKVITSDITFVKYLSDKNFDAIIIEDADELLTSSRGEYNKIISKILNVSDGLIKLPKKKLILTTNLEKLQDLDPAIIRPGRCFDVMEFRPFTQEEYLNVAQGIGLDLTDEEKSKPEMTLAELYSIRELQNNGDPLLQKSHKIKTNKVGFF